jgi:hypothetical protein
VSGRAAIAYLLMAADGDAARSDFRVGSWNRLEEEAIPEEDSHGKMEEELSDSRRSMAWSRRVVDKV